MSEIFDKLVYRLKRNMVFEELEDILERLKIVNGLSIHEQNEMTRETLNMIERAVVEFIAQNHEYLKNKETI